MPVLVVFGVAFSLLELFVIACVVLAIIALIKYNIEKGIYTIPIHAPTFDRTWPEPTTIPIEEVKPITRPPVAIPIDKPIAIPKPRKQEKGIYNVYDLHLSKDSEERDYTWGKGFVTRLLLKNSIYKYGLTSFPTVFLRYFVIDKIYPSEKGKYILDQLRDVVFLPKQWYLPNRVPRAKASEKEVKLIKDYQNKHGQLPPGNTFLG